jgi:hypothetical protein
MTTSVGSEMCRGDANPTTPASGFTQCLTLHLGGTSNRWWGLRPIAATREWEVG